MNEIEETSSQEVKAGKEIIIDYLTGSHEFLCNDNEVELQAVEDTVEFFRQLLNVPKERVVPMEFGKGNYRYGYQIGDGVTYKLCGPLNEKGIHTNCLEMKGEGCREFERNNGVDAWEKFLFTLGCSSINFRCSRLDLTIDHYEHKGVTFDWVKSKLDRGMYTSGFKKPYTIHGDHIDGFSITFGKRKADNKLSKQLCIYEKDKEQRAKGKECNQENWTRFEMRFMHEKAQRVFDDLLYAYTGKLRYPEEKKIPEGIEGFKTFVASLLYSLLDIKEDNDYDSSNKNKAKTDPLWLEFIGNVEKAKIGTPLPKEPSWNKFNKYVGQTIGIYDICNFIKSGTNLNQYFKLCAQRLSEQINLISDNKIKINKINSYLSDSNNEAISKELLLEQKEKIDEFLFNEEVPW